jgi:hypothetical protein
MNQDAAFYVNGAGHEVVWQKNGNRFFVVRNGEMRIHYSPDSENQQVIRYTDQLEAIGVKNDADLEKFTALGDEMFYWANNSWFEVWDSEDPDYYSEPYHEFTDAVGQAEVLLKESVLESK